ncbi:hypothetical protein TWF730_005844 [Orbilia blumenaviensis]|uniref:SAC3/GANP/THP3 conserved domain-containing protein n=1 Tax=Orbilia blumenaviensis TaxID=1796055 RepID=A0AAV9VMS4_9PEZI
MKDTEEDWPTAIHRLEVHGMRNPDFTALVPTRTAQSIPLQQLRDIEASRPAKPPVNLSTLQHELKHSSISEEDMFKDAVQVRKRRVEEYDKERERKRLTAAKRILEDHKELVGICVQMCPRWDRLRRANNKSAISTYEVDENGYFGETRAVKSWHRPAAGDAEDLPEDLRTEETLMNTMNYLVHDIIDEWSFPNCQNFVWDRTRSIRQDCSIQGLNSDAVIGCYERIARFHIFSLQQLSHDENFQRGQELEQLSKTLISLNELYDDRRRLIKQGKRQYNPETDFESEFRAYTLVSNLYNPLQIARALQLPPRLLETPIFRIALLLFKYAQRANHDDRNLFGNTSKSGITLNWSSHFFDLVYDPSTPYLLACLAALEFTNVKKGAIKTFEKGFPPQKKASRLSLLKPLVDAPSEQDVKTAVERYGLKTSEHDGAIFMVSQRKSARSTWIAQPPPIAPQFPLTVEGKRGQIITGKFVPARFYIDEPGCYRRVVSQLCEEEVDIRYNDPIEHEPTTDGTTHVIQFASSWESVGTVVVDPEDQVGEDPVQDALFDLIQSSRNGKVQAARSQDLINLLAQKKKKAAKRAFVPVPAKTVTQPVRQQVQRQVPPPFQGFSKAATDSSSGQLKAPAAPSAFSSQPVTREASPAVQPPAPSAFGAAPPVASAFGGPVSAFGGPVSAFGARPAPVSAFGPKSAAPAPLAFGTVVPERPPAFGAGSPAASGTPPPQSAFQTATSVPPPVSVFAPPPPAREADKQPASVFDTGPKAQADTGPSAVGQKPPALPGAPSFVPSQTPASKPPTISIFGPPKPEPPKETVTSFFPPPPVKPSVQSIFSSTPAQEPPKSIFDSAPQLPISSFFPSAAPETQPELALPAPTNTPQVPPPLSSFTPAVTASTTPKVPVPEASIFGEVSKPPETSKFDQIPSEASIFGELPKPEPTSIFGEIPKLSGTSIFDQTPKPPEASIFDQAPTVPGTSIFDQVFKAPEPSKSPAQENPVPKSPTVSDQVKQISEPDSVQPSLHDDLPKIQVIEDLDPVEEEVSPPREPKLAPSGLPLPEDVPQNDNLPSPPELTWRDVVRPIPREDIRKYNAKLGAGPWYPGIDSLNKFEYTDITQLASRRQELKNCAWHKLQLSECNPNGLPALLEADAPNTWQLQIVCADQGKRSLKWFMNKFGDLVKREGEDTYQDEHVASSHTRGQDGMIGGIIFGCTAMKSNRGWKKVLSHDKGVFHRTVKNALKKAPEDKIQILVVAYTGEGKTRKAQEKQITSALGVPELEQGGKIQVKLLVVEELADLEMLDKVVKEFGVGLRKEKQVTPPTEDPVSSAVPPEIPTASLGRKRSLDSLDELLTTQLMLKGDKPNHGNPSTAKRRRYTEYKKPQAYIYGLPPIENPPEKATQRERNLKKRKSIEEITDSKKRKIQTATDNVSKALSSVSAKFDAWALPDGDDDLLAPDDMFDGNSSSFAAFLDGFSGPGENWDDLSIGGGNVVF